jgi:hypothetical protein
MVVYAQKKYIKISGSRSTPLGSPHASCNIRILAQINQLTRGYNSRKLVHAKASTTPRFKVGVRGARNWSAFPFWLPAKPRHH